MVAELLVLADGALRMVPALVRLAPVTEMSPAPS